MIMDKFISVIISAVGINFLQEAYSSAGGSDSRGPLYLSTAQYCVPAPPTACLISAEEAEHKTIIIHPSLERTSLALQKFKFQLD